MECINQEIEQYLCLFINHHQDDWAEWVSLTGFCYNDHAHSSIGHFPFFLNHGWHPYKNLEPQMIMAMESIEIFAKHMK